MGRFKVGQKVQYQCGKIIAQGIVIRMEHYLFGSFYVVQFEDGRLVQAGWNQLTEVA